MLAGRVMAVLADNQHDLPYKKGRPPDGLSLSGAGERVRTVDLNLGKVALYQLSYARDYRVPFCRAGGNCSPSLPPVKNIVENA